ncbi:MAG: DNA mismatch repair protein MutS [Ignavibacteria bacterium GWB2_35_6b]|nr:MAG: DNA mismatch repair protein MutS [Ignavibacteria bacterium GWB2_35_6b]
MISKQVLEKLEFNKVLEYISVYTYTVNGKDIIQNKRPYDNVDDVLKYGKYVSEAKEILIKNDLPPLSYIPDLNTQISTAKIEDAVLNLQNIKDILSLAETSRKLYQFLKLNEESETLSQDFLNNLFVDKVFEHHISKIFDESGEISDNASPKLKEIRVEIKNKADQLRKVVNRLLRQLSESYLVQEDYMTQRDGRLVLPIKSEHKRHVRGFIHSESSTGQTVYIEPEETLELNNDILSLSFAEKREIERILKQVTKKIGEVSDQLKISLRAISEIDAVFASAKYSIETIGSFPTFDIEKPFTLLDGRHPVLIKKIGLNKTVPLNLEIKDQNIILITGPNAGGKTVVLKTAGLLLVMALSGFHIPAHPDSNLHFADKVLVDIGDQQSIEDDLSTFSSHLSNIQNILRQADSKSLILLDEIGTGTDPAEGSALATAILIQLKNKKAKVLASTHHGNLKIIANDMECFQNASMEFDAKELKPTYYFKQGTPGSSYAFEVASRIGFDNEFINLAKEYLDTDKTKLEDFLVKLEENSNNLAKKLRDSEIENARLKGLTNLYKNKLEELEEKKKKILTETKEKAEDYLKDINKKVETAIKNIREQNAEKDVIKQEKKTIAKVVEDAKKLVAAEEKQITLSDKKLNVGDYAIINGTQTYGVVEEINEEKNKAVIVSGSIKLQVKLSQLQYAKKKDVVEAGSYQNSFIPEIKSFRLDIRGKKPEEAENEIIRFIDDSYAAGVNQVEIVHGKGTGVLKKYVRELLDNNIAVNKYYYANIEFGGEGITIVELK